MLPNGVDTVRSSLAYSQPLRMGKYEKTVGVEGKYDYVRRLWEDWVTGHFLGPYLRELVGEKKRQGRGLRILDLGCGAGDGLELIGAIPLEEHGSPEGRGPLLVTDDLLAEYVGVDINEDLLRQARACHARDAKASFVQADLSEGLPSEILVEHEPFDLYFSSYAMLSHFGDSQCEKILADVSRHARSHALFVGDWLGRYSYEWQNLWSVEAKADCFMEYRMSYLYDVPQRRAVDIPCLPMRLMDKDGILAIVQRAAQSAGTYLRARRIFDRSILVGRHLDTREYNHGCPPLRRAINSLFAGNQSTDLNQLLVQYAPRPGFDDLNDFFAGFFGASNRLVTFAMGLLGDEEPHARRSSLGLDPASDPLAQGMELVQSAAIRGVSSVDVDDMRANLLEPALGLALRNLEAALQTGTGAGHSIAAVVDVGKSISL